jgi:hypothetical protein
VLSEGRHYVLQAVQSLKIEEQVWLLEQATQLQKVVIFVNASRHCVEKISFFLVIFFIFFVTCWLPSRIVCIEWGRNRIFKCYVIWNFELRHIISLWQTWQRVGTVRTYKAGDKLSSRHVSSHKTFYFQLLPYPFPCVGSHMLISIIWSLGVI